MKAGTHTHCTVGARPGSPATLRAIPSPPRQILEPKLAELGRGMAAEHGRMADEFNAVVQEIFVRDARMQPAA